MNDQQSDTSELTAPVSYHEKLAGKWSAFYGSTGFNRRRAFLKERLISVVKHGARWLDAGCGSGIFTRELAYLGATGVAVDGSPGMLAAALAEAGGSVCAFEYRQIVTVERLDETDATFDGVLCSSVVEYLASPDDALSEFFRVLKPGGYLLVSVPHRYSVVRLTQKVVRRLAAFFGKNLIAYLAFSRHDFSTGTIGEKLEKVGFIVDRVDEFDPILPERLLGIFPASLLVISAHKP